jgi:3-oxoadipate enol-lactonase
VIPHHRLDGPSDAPVLALSNSLGAALEMWEPQMPAFTREFRVLRYDHRGHGGSPAPPGPYSVELLAGDLLELLDRAGVERAYLCGLSLGGAVAMWLAACVPQRVERVVLACTTTRFGTPDQWRERAAVVRREGVGAVVEAALARWFTPGLRERQPELVQEFRTHYLAVSAEAYARYCEALADWDFADSAGEIAAPTLVICGEDDPVVPPADARATASAIPGAGLAVIPDAAHLANIDQPGPFGEAAIAHLTGQERRRETV